MNTRSKLAADQFYNWQLLPMTKDRSNTYTFRSAISHLRKNYLNPKSGVSFSGVNKIYQFYDKVIPIKTIKNFLVMMILILCMLNLLRNATTLHLSNIKVNKCKLI